MKRTIVIAAGLVLASATVAAAECITYVNYNSPIGDNDPAAQLLRCWVQTQGGKWNCSQYQCTNKKTPSWTYRATNTVCLGDTCTETVINASGGVVMSGYSQRGPDAFTTVYSTDYEGKGWYCDTISETPNSNSGVFYTIVCPE